MVSHGQHLGTRYLDHAPVLVKITLRSDIEHTSDGAPQYRLKYEAKDKLPIHYYSLTFYLQIFMF